MSVGFIGLGIMGEGMALNLLKSGRSLAVWNRTHSKCEALAASAAGKARAMSRHEPGSSGQA